MTFSQEIPRRFAGTFLAIVLLLSLLPQATPMALAVEAFAGHIERVLLDAVAASPAEELRVIVGKKIASDPSLELTIASRGGEVTGSLPVIDGFSATMPASLVRDLADDPNLRSLSLDRTGKFETISWDEDIVASNYTKTTGAGKMWAQGNYGGGVGVAVIDTGVSPMNDFVANGNRVVHGPDFSGEGNILDSYGHGTVMAGVIAGDGYDSTGQSGGAFVGMAPGASIISVKVAGANGSTDVSTILAAMHWVAAYRDQYNIRVVNLSWGTQGTQSYRYDPLNYAVERLWQLGITVVVAAGNSGPKSSTITKPGDDPFVITVGAYDDKGNTDPSDDSIPSWTSRGPTAADNLIKPDVVAPGRLITATRSYGSTVEAAYPKALRKPSYIRGSGSSQATAAVSGAVALMLHQKPHLSPAQVKYLLMNTADPISTFYPNDQGAGRIDVHTAANSSDEGYANLDTPPSSGLGSLEASRGGHHVETDCFGDGVIDVIQGEITVQCEPWDGATWTGSTWTGATWTGGTWTGGTWTGGTWTAGDWSGTTWTGTTWTGGTWTGGTWTGGTWTTGDWSGATWTGTTWTGGTWTGSTWTGGTWTGSTWTGGTWTGGTWTGGTWTGTTWTTGSYDDEFTSAEYDEEDNEFMTVFWGNSPPWFEKVRGERSDPRPASSRIM